MDLYWKIVFTAILIGAIFIIITAIIVPFKKERLENIFALFSLSFLGGGIAMILINVLIDIFKLIWVS